jgi:hypothetical protein
MPNWSETDDRSMNRYDPGQKSPCRRGLVLALLTVVHGVASAGTFRYTLEHEGSAVGAVRYDRVEAGDRIRTREYLWLY